ncbi:MAG: phenylalanine--tRNA ligase subunit alpha [Desulfurococcaceae archaeon]|jgi:phenylalanyl-tRNA synthetase alpha chain
MQIYVTPRQYAILKKLVERETLSVDDVAREMGVKREDIMRDLAELEHKGLLTIEKITQEYYVLTHIGRLYLETSFPEEVLYSQLNTCSHTNIQELLMCVETRTKMPIEELRIGLQYLIRSECVLVHKGEIIEINEAKCKELLESTTKLREALRIVAEGGPISEENILEILKRRKTIERRERRDFVLRATRTLLEFWKTGAILEKEVLTIVKPEHALMMDKYIIKEFDLSVEPYAPPISRKHPFMQFIDDLRDILVSMGFEEVKGPHVEAELWNFDVLFQAQDHPAREIHDTFFVKGSRRSRAEVGLLERVKKVHEEGWGYKWSAERALRLVLRSQTTAVTARAIYERGGGEYRVFTIDRNFRPENLDAKHSMEFYQLDGVIVGREVSFKHLLYFFKELAAALGIKEVWFKPAYFPFTEPSVEGYVKHPKLGWIEVFPGGMFRPEVMKILGAEGYNAAAWGIGVDRLAMVVLGLDDIRLLFTRDLEKLASTKYRGLDYFTKKTSGCNVKVVEIPEVG